jgi:glycosyltransferase involved in cell wall biosynthesis
MKTIQCLARYFPDKCGGIQVNLSELIPELRSHQVEVKIAAAKSNSTVENCYQHNGVEVYRYPVSPVPRPQPNHGQFPHPGFAYFARWLSAQKADIYHQHHWEVICGLPHLRLAKKLGMATVVTVHSAIPICQRTTLMFEGQQPCDGKIDVVRCSYCCDRLTQKLPALAVKMLSRIPMSVVSRLQLPASVYLPCSQAQKNPGAYFRPLFVPGYVRARQSSLLSMAKFADRIIAVCDWLYQALLINGIPKEKIILCRAGILTCSPRKQLQLKSQQEPLKVVFLGRLEAFKGLHVLIEAVKNLPPTTKVELVIHGIFQHEAYRKQIIELIGKDSRIRLAKELTREELPTVLTNYDLLAVPSQGLETGPLVVLEAHARSLPVIGSNVGGIAELVKHGIDGWLVPANDIQAWSEALQLLARDRHLLQQLSQGVKDVRTVNVQAKELAEIYTEVIKDTKIPCP